MIGIIYRLQRSDNGSALTLFWQNRHLNEISILSAKLFPDRFQDADNITDVSIFIPDTLISIETILLSDC